MAVLTLADGDGLAYRTVGQGDPLLLVLGTGSSMGNWPAQLVESLSVRFRVVVYDHRGMGQSSPSSRAVTVASLAGDAAALLDQLGLGSAHVVGHSLGSAIAQELALSRPDLVASLVLYGTWGRMDGFARALFAGLRAPWTYGDAATGIAALGVARSPEALDDPVFAEAVKAAQPSDPHTAAQVAMTARQFDADMAHDTLDRLDQISASTTVIVGEQDLLTPPRLGRAVADAIPGARFELVTGPGSSHDLFIERPQDWLNLVWSHLDRVGPARIQAR